MEAGLSDHAWTIRDLVAMGKAALPKPTKRGSYKNREQNSIRATTE
jgi:hypothetical protein